MIRKEAMESRAFCALKDIYENREKIVKLWRAQGKQIVLELGSDVPDELIIAGGMLPIRVYADPQKPLLETNKYLEFSFDPVVRTQFEKLVDGTYFDLADYLAISNSTDVIVRIFLYLREIRRVEPDKKVPELEFIDWLFSRHRMHQERNEALIRMFWETAERWAGRTITAEEFRDAAKICNDDRQAMRKIGIMRRSNDCRISGSEALVIIGSSLFMDKAEHAVLTREIIGDAGRWPVLTGPRIFYTGSVQESTALYDMIESSGGIVIGEDHDWGDRHYDRYIQLDIDPVRAIVDRYMLRQFSSKKGLVSQRVESLDNDVNNAAADGVIFFTNIYEDAASWDYPSQKNSLESRSISTRAYIKQQYPLEKNTELESDIRAFVDSLKGCD